MQRYSYTMRADSGAVEVGIVMAEDERCAIIRANHELRDKGLVPKSYYSISVGDSLQSFDNEPRELLNHKGLVVIMDDDGMLIAKDSNEGAKEFRRWLKGCKVYRVGIDGEFDHA